MFSECFKVFLVLFDIWAENRMFECLSRKPDFQKFLKKPQNIFSWCFLSVPRYFSIVRNLSREPDFSAKNRIFKNFSKSLKTCLVGVFWVFHGILALFDIWAENRIFQPRIGFSKNVLKCLKACLVSVFWVFQSICIRPFEKRDVLCRGNVRPSVYPSVCPSRFSGLFFNMLWDINLKLGIYIQ